MKLKALVTYVLAASLLMFQDLHAAAPTVIDTFVADAKKATVRVRITHTLRVVLPVPSPDLPNHEWQITSNDARFLRMTSSPKPASAADRPGTKPDNKSDIPAVSGPVWTVSLIALRPGRSILRLVYVRASNSGEEIPVDTREIVVTVHNDPEPKTS